MVGVQRTRAHFLRDLQSSFALLAFMNVSSGAAKVFECVFLNVVPARTLLNKCVFIVAGSSTSQPPLASSPGGPST